MWIVYVIESAAYGVVFTNCLCENPNEEVRASEGFSHKQRVNITPYKMEFLAIERQRISRKLNISAAREQKGQGLEYRRIMGNVIWAFKFVIAGEQSV